MLLTSIFEKLHGQFFFSLSQLLLVQLPDTFKSCGASMLGKILKSVYVEAFSARLLGIHDIRIKSLKSSMNRFMEVVLRCLRLIYINFFSTIF